MKRCLKVISVVIVVFNLFTFSQAECDIKPPTVENDTLEYCDFYINRNRPDIVDDAGIEFDGSLIWYYEYYDEIGTTRKPYLDESSQGFYEVSNKVGDCESEKVSIYVKVKEVEELKMNLIQDKYEVCEWDSISFFAEPTINSPGFYTFKNYQTEDSIISSRGNFIQFFDDLHGGHVIDISFTLLDSVKACSENSETRKVKWYPVNKSPKAEFRIPQESEIYTLNEQFSITAEESHYNHLMTWEIISGQGSILNSFRQEVTVGNLLETKSPNNQTKIKLVVKDKYKKCPSDSAFMIIDRVEDKVLSNIGINMNEEIILFPNPVKEWLNIGGINKTDTIIIYDALGNLIEEFAFTERLFFGNLETGFYYLKLSNSPMIYKFSKVN